MSIIQEDINFEEVEKALDRTQIEDYSYEFVENDWISDLYDGELTNTTKVKEDDEYLSKIEEMINKQEENTSAIETLSDTVDEMASDLADMSKNIKTLIYGQKYLFDRLNKILAILSPGEITNNTGDK